MHLYVVAKFVGCAYLPTPLTAKQRRANTCRYASNCFKKNCAEMRTKANENNSKPTEQAPSSAW